MSDDYFGYNAGFGALVHLSDSYFLNFRAMYDFTSVDLSTGSEDIDGVIGTVGIGLKL